jgi:hypothetical protein
VEVAPGKGLSRHFTFVLPHLAHRAMMIKRYPDGASGKFFPKKLASPRAPIHSARYGLDGIAYLLKIRDEPLEFEMALFFVGSPQDS